MVRFLDNLLFPNILIWGMFPRKVQGEILLLVREAEKGHAGEIRVCVESALPLLSVLSGTTARKRAEYLFNNNRIWDTENNTGVLIYLLLSEKKLEILYDRGISLTSHDKQRLIECFLVKARSGNFVAAFAGLLEELQHVLTQSIPQDSQSDENEIPDGMILGS